MSTIKINELATSVISLTDFFAKADASGLANKNTVQGLSNFLNTVGTLAYRGVLLASDAAVTLDGIYVAGDDGTYTNNGGLVITLSNQIVLVSVTGMQTVFEKVEIPLTTVADGVIESGNTEPVSGNTINEAISIINDNVNITNDSVPINFNVDGFYTLTGAFSPNSDWKNSGFLPIPISLFYKGGGLGPGAANIVFYDASNNVTGGIEYDELTFNADNYINNFPANTTQFIACRRTNDSTVCKIGNSILINQTYNKIKAKTNYFNYLKNYNKLNDIPFVGNVKSGTDPTWVMSDSDLFIENGIDKSWKLTHSAGNSSFYKLVSDDFRSTLESSRLINVKFNIISSIDVNLQMEMYQSSTSFSTIGVQFHQLKANKISEVNITYEIPQSAIDNGLDFLWFFFIGLSAGSYEISSFQMWDGLIPHESINNLLSKNDFNKLYGNPNSYKFLNTLFIGDSISVGTGRGNWKANLENYYNLNYLREITGQTRPAIGGTPLLPPVSETTGSESIWYRCASNRLNVYNAELIVLFGGTNDMDLSKPMGDRTDTPFVAGDTRPASLTWASSLMGCIEMLQTSQPGVEIILMTILNAKRGLDLDYSPYTEKEKMARITMEVAVDYGLKCVPLYYTTGINENNINLFTDDTVHPNNLGGERITSAIRDTLYL